MERYIFLLLDSFITIKDHFREIHLILHENEFASFPCEIANNLPLSFHSASNKSWKTLHALVDSLNPSLLHIPFNLPSRHPNCPVIYTLHDAGRYIFPELMVRNIRNIQSPRLLNALQEGTVHGLITVSESSRKDIERLLPLGDVNCYVVPNFLSSPFLRALEDPTPVSDLQSRFHIDFPYILAVGVYSPTKNIETLCNAFHLCKLRCPNVIPPLLVLVGRRGWERKIPWRSSPDILCTGHVSERDLVSLYREASCLAFPSMYEGFGLPLLEALATDCPVICSDLPVFNEIGGNAVYQVDSRNANLLANSLCKFFTEFVPDPMANEQILKYYGPELAGQRLLDAYHDTIATFEMFSC